MLLRGHACLVGTVSNNNVQLLLVLVLYVYLLIFVYSIWLTGEYTQKTEWHRVTVFRPVLRDIVSQNVRRG